MWSEVELAAIRSSQEPSGAEKLQGTLTGVPLSAPQGYGSWPEALDGVSYKNRGRKDRRG